MGRAHVTFSYFGIHTPGIRRGYFKGVNTEENPHII